MHATRELRRVRARRTLMTFVAASMLAVSAFAGPATAATPSWEMTVTPLPSQVKPGDVAGYRVVISNPGPSNISQVFLTNALDTTDELVSADPYEILNTAFVSFSQGDCDPVGVRLDCTLGAIRANESATIVVAYATPPAAEQLLVIFEANTTGIAGDAPGSSHGDVLQGIGLTTTNPSDNFGGRFLTTDNLVVSNGLGLGAGNQQSGKVNAPKVGIGVSIEDGTGVSFEGDGCPVTCWSETWALEVDGGAFYGNGFKLEIGVYKDLVETVHGVWHEYDTPHLDGDGNPTITGEDITTKCPKKGSPSSSQIPCFSVSSIGGGDILVTVWLKENGKGGLY
jgi:uncharacterized repeat protein (TIGR01451 family)